MPGILETCDWLEHTSWATGIRQALWLFPILETAHLFGIVLLVAGTTALDLRLLGLSFRERAVSEMALQNKNLAAICKMQGGAAFMRREKWPCCCEFAQATFVPLVSC
jgi:hypothetical protein